MQKKKVTRNACCLIDCFASAESKYVCRQYDESCISMAVTFNQTKHIISTAINERLPNIQLREASTSKTSTYSNRRMLRNNRKVNDIQRYDRQAVTGEHPVITKAWLLQAVLVSLLQHNLAQITRCQLKVTRLQPFISISKACGDTVII
jgi:hypothetical protein